MVDTNLTTFPTTNSQTKPKIVDANYDNSKMSRDDFMKILLANLQWQDPLNAQDISSFIDNTVKLRQMESLNSIDNLVNQLSQFTNSILNASSLIGKNVKYEGNYTYVNNGQSNIEFKLSAPAKEVSVSLIDGNGNVVESKQFADLNGNTVYPFQIDNPNLSNGYYKVDISAKDGNGNSINTTVYSTAQVSSIIKENNVIFAKINGNNVSLDKIFEIY